MTDIDRLQEAYGKPDLTPRVLFQIGSQLDLQKHRMTDQQLNRQKEIESDFRRRVLRVMQPRY
jgi:hypothetical protein